MSRVLKDVLTDSMRVFSQSDMKVEVRFPGSVVLEIVLLSLLVFEEEC